MNDSLETRKDEGKAGRYYVYLISFVAAVGGFLFGYDLAVINGAQLYLEEQFGLSGHSLGFAVSSAILGCCFGPFIAGPLSDAVGRKRTLILASLLLAVSAIGTAFPRDIITFNLFRILGGVGVGIASMVSPMYIAEIAPARARGALVTLNQLAILLGCLISVMIAHYLAANIVETHSWRWMFGLECVPVICFVAFLKIVPRSPRWLAEKGHYPEALQVITMVQGKTRAEQELLEIKESLQAETGKFSELFQPGIRMAVFVAVGLAILQQWSGVSIISAYLAKIFQMAGYAAKTDSLRMTVYTYIFNFALTVVALLLVDRVGRRPLLLIGSAGMAIGLFLMGLIFHLEMTGGWVLAVMFICQAAYVVSLAPLAWLVIAEIFPTRIRSRAMSVATLTLWAACFTGVWLFSPLREFFANKYGSPAGVFWIFTGVCAYSFFFCWKFVPETKGKTLEEIAGMWLHKK